MKACIGLLLVTFAAATAYAQCPPPSGAFQNNTAGTGCELNIITGSDSTANSGFTPATQDNLATATTGQPLTVTLSNPQGFAGAPLGIFFQYGGPFGPLSLGTDSVFLTGALPVFSVIDGTGLTGFPSPFATHPGPQNLFALSGLVPQAPSIASQCLTFQAVLQDATVPPFNVRISNAVQLQIRAGIAGFAPNFGAEGSAITMYNTGSGTGLAHFPIYNPSRQTLPTVVTSGVTGFSTIVPVAAQSGGVAYEDNASLGNLSNADDDDMTSFFAVTSPSGLLPLTAGSPLTTSVSPFNPFEQWATGFATLGGAANTDSYTVTLAAGDIITVELYSVNSTTTAILDGYGSSFNAFATNGFDPLVELRHSSNTNALTYGTGGTNILVHGDDDSGPGFNSKLVYQAKAADTFRIDVRASSAATFLSGEYLLNVRILSGTPVVSRFTISGVSNANVASPGQTVTVNGANFQVGFPYNVNIRPRHNLYPAVTATGNATSATTLTFTMPNLSNTTPILNVGSHDVTITDGATGATGLVTPTDWTPINTGPIPELLVARSVTLTTQATGTPVLTPNLTTVINSSATANFGAFQQFAVTAGQNIFCEVLGFDSGIATFPNPLRVDCIANFSGAAGGVYNPNITLFAPGFVPIVAQNDDNGIYPLAFNWVDGGSAGIGINSALLVNAGNLTGNYLLLYTQNITFGAAPYGCLVNIVVR